MKLLQLVRTSARVLLLLAGSGVAAVGALTFAPQSCTGPAHERPANGLTYTVAAGPPLVTETVRVVRVVDGDTYDVLAGGLVRRVRLLGVDAPERDQPFGKLATDSVARLLWPAQLVLLTRHGVDLYGRTLGAVRLPVAGKPALALDSLLVVRGWAWAWDPNHRIAGRAAQQAAALQGRRGLWKCGVSQPVPPKLWRSFNAQNKRRYGVGCTW
ncbi:thermonuclease family protein [Hymenobacter sp. BT770]|uniref:thermonuclease family protein n=1 Tax=Hymenobacter sp. BT770 TaxID=2886942 RepID=UPI001D12B490|nr:thermonuclease family protein [Hymenobacter sp. BT770]MCC3154570.1 thermonuclease family protein [Hymenobacter sp. BT770]MDO3416624.1 thermonuclease family protein [Hymenobacter sp. BT770]